MLHDLIMVPSKNNSFSPVNIKNIPVTVGQKLKKTLEYVKCKSRKQCKIKKSSCLYFTTLFRKDTLRVLSTQLKNFDDDDIW